MAASVHTRLMKGTLVTRIMYTANQGRSEGGGGSWGTREPSICKPFLRKQPTIFRGETAMTIMFDTA